MSLEVTCTACQTTVVGDEQRRLHYRSDLHLVNLKRKVAGLGPLTTSEFESRLAVLHQSKLASAPGDKRRRGPREKYTCSICRKTFSSQQALHNHEKSRRHIDTLNARSANVSVISEDADPNWQAEYPNDDDAGIHIEQPVNTTGKLQTFMDNTDDATMDDDNEDVDRELETRMKAWNEKGSDCRSAFDDAQFTTADAALHYMQQNFGLFVPYAERLVDKEGLVRYLSQKVSIGYACTACDKGFSTITDARKHMLDLGHCRLPADDDGFFDEFAEFYDWNERTDQNAGEADDDEGWEEAGADHDHELILQNAAPGQVIVMSGDQQGEQNTNLVEHPIGRLDLGADDEGGEDTYALVVGNKVIGHRSLVRYYRQSSGQQIDNREAIVAHRKGGKTLDLATIQSMKRIPMDEKLTGQKYARRQQKRFELMVGRKNYYVRKSKFKQKMGVLNSGYRP